MAELKRDFMNFLTEIPAFMHIEIICIITHKPLNPHIAEVAKILKRFVFSERRIAPEVTSIIPQKSDNIGFLFSGKKLIATENRITIEQIVARDEQASLTLLKKQTDIGGVFFDLSDSTQLIFDAFKIKRVKADKIFETKIIIPSEGLKNILHPMAEIKKDGPAPVQKHTRISASFEDILFSSFDIATDFAPDGNPPIIP